MKKIFSLLFAIMVCYSSPLLAQNVGIGTSNPSKARFVVQGSVGAVSAMFGDTTSGVSIENNWPGIGLNSYFNGGRKSITHGFGGLLGMNPDNGDFHIMSAADSAGVNAGMALYYRMLINKTGNMGIQGNTNPLAPLSFSTATGNKIFLRGNADTAHYGLGSQVGLLQIYAPDALADIVFGYGSSTKFTENMRIKGNGLVGIGTNNPTKGKLVLQGTVGSVSAIFGDTTSGVAIENNFPGIAFNSYYNFGRRSITHGYGAVTGMNPNNGDFYILSSADSVAANTALGVFHRLLINKTGNIGVQGNTTPVAPLSFSNATGNKILFRGNTDTSHYGLGTQSGLLQMYTPDNGADIAFGYGSSTNFTESVRITGAGKLGIGTSTPLYPVTLEAEGNGFVQKGTAVEIGTATTASAGLIKTYTNHPLFFSTGNNSTQLALTYSGRLGLGTTTPATKMEIRHTDFDLFQLTNTTALAAGKNVEMTFKTGSSYTGSIGTYGINGTEARMGFATGPFLQERFTIRGNGYVGINNSNPTHQLDVNGSATVTGALDVSGRLTVSEMSYGLCLGYTINSGDILAGDKKVVINDDRLNGKSGLRLFVTRKDNAFAEIPVRAIYDHTLEKWCLYTNGYYGSGLTTIGYSNCQGNCVSLTIPIWSECKFNSGEQYNILAMY